MRPRWTNRDTERATLSALVGTLGMCLLGAGMVLWGVVKMVLRWK